MSDSPRRNLLRLQYYFLSQYEKETNLAPLEFMEKLMASEGIAPSEDDVNVFIRINRYMKILEDVSHDFIDKFKIRSVCHKKLKLLVFLILFYLNQKSYEEALQNLRSSKSYYILLLLSYFQEEENQIFIAKQACKIFDNQFVLKEIVRPLVDKQPLLNQLLLDIQIDKWRQSVRKPPTIPIAPNVLTRTPLKPPPAPINTPLEEENIVAREVPKTTYEPDQKIKKNLEKEFKKNREKAERLMKIVTGSNCSLSKPKKPVAEKPLILKNPIKANKVPEFKPVEVRGNISSTLREANIIFKDQENELKRIEEIIKTGVDHDKFEKLEADRRASEEKAKMEEIEKKHLKGLLTYEEAILAKQNLVKLNQEKFMQMKQERIKLLEEIEEFKNREMEKYKNLVEKAQEIEKGAKDAEKRVQEEKQQNVKLMQFESKQMLAKAQERKQRELFKKMELVKELKALQQVRASICPAKEFDPTEGSNIGLLCEMSIAELQERLAMVRISMKMELEEKRTQISKRKEEQNEMLENVKNFIAETRRMSKAKPVPIVTSKVEQSSELLELRKKLEEKRKNRTKLS